MGVLRFGVWGLGLTVNPKPLKGERNHSWNGVLSDDPFGNSHKPAVVGDLSIHLTDTCVRFRVWGLGFRYKPQPTLFALAYVGSDPGSDPRP